MNKTVKKIILLSLVAKGVILGASALVAIRHEASKKIVNKRFTNKLSEIESALLMEENYLNINAVYSEIKEFFKETLVNDETNEILKNESSSMMNIEFENFKKIELESRYDKKEKEVYYYKLIFETKESNKTEVKLLLTNKNWNGFIEMTLFDGVVKKINEEFYFKINSTNPIFYLKENDVVVKFKKENTYYIDKNSTKRKKITFLINTKNKLEEKIKN